MEESSGKGDLHGNLMRLSSIRAPGTSCKSTLSGRSSPRNSPSFRRLHSSRAPRRESKAAVWRFQWVRSNRVVFWLTLIAVWAYTGFHVQSKWMHSDRSKAGFVGYKSEQGSSKKEEHVGKVAEYVVPNATVASGKEPKLGVSLAAKEKQVPRRKGKRHQRKLRRVSPRAKGEVMDNTTAEVGDGMMITRKNTSYGLFVGPFGRTEDGILEWNANKRKGACDRKGDFARIVWSRSFVLIFHELSMTGAPLSMMELATEILSCGGSVAAVVLSRKGGLLGELERRGIKVLKDRWEPSYKTAMKADLVIAGSAVCSSWIEEYLTHYPASSSQIVWWIMENRREYFDRSKHMLNQVKMLTFLSDSQSKQWLSWCKDEKVQLKSQPMLVPLSVNDELAFVAGIPCSLNTPAFSVEKMIEKRNLLRSAVRKEMGLGDNDMLVMSLSSINPGKGQRLLLEAALLVAEHNVSIEELKINTLVEEKEFLEAASLNQTTMNHQLNSTASVQATNQSKTADDLPKSATSSVTSKKRKRKRSTVTNILSSSNHIKSVVQGNRQNVRNLLSEVGNQEETLKVLVGSIGSKSNKVLYLRAILRFLSQHSNLSKIVLWTPATTRVASLYASADVYVINAQGLGETFGRVTIEAMAFGLPVLGTDAGGTQEIVEHGLTGLLHPIGREGTKTLAQNIQYLLSHRPVREKMGMRGRQKVRDKYLKHQTYDRFARVLAQCMKPK